MVQAQCSNYSEDKHEEISFDLSNLGGPMHTCQFAPASFSSSRSSIFSLVFPLIRVRESNMMSLKTKRRTALVRTCTARSPFASLVVRSQDWCTPSVTLARRPKAAVARAEPVVTVFGSAAASY